MLTLLWILLKNTSRSKRSFKIVDNEWALAHSLLAKKAESFLIRLFAFMGFNNCLAFHGLEVLGCTVKARSFLPLGRYPQAPRVSHGSLLLCIFSKRFSGRSPPVRRK